MPYLGYCMEMNSRVWGNTSFLDFCPLSRGVAQQSQALLEVTLGLTPGLTIVLVSYLLTFSVLSFQEFVTATQGGCGWAR